MRARAFGLVGAVYLGLATGASAASASEPPVVVGEVATRVAGGSPDAPRELRQTLDSAIGSLSAQLPQRAKRFVLSASIVKMEHQTSGAAEWVSCTVSIVLREQKSGAIRAILEGRARASGQGADSESVALDAAARTALASLPEAMR